MGKDMTRNFTGEDTVMPKKHVRKSAASLAIRDIHIKTTMKYHLTPGKMVKNNKTGKNKCWRGCGER